jgi:hypothetical protein
MEGARRDCSEILIIALLPRFPGKHESKLSQSVIVMYDITFLPIRARYFINCEVAFDPYGIMLTHSFNTNLAVSCCFSPMALSMPCGGGETQVYSGCEGCLIKGAGWDQAVARSC